MGSYSSHQHRAASAQPCMGNLGSSCPCKPVSTVNPSLPLAANSLMAEENNSGKAHSSAPSRIMCFESRREAEFPFRFLEKEISAFFLQR